MSAAASLDAPLSPFAAGYRELIGAGYSVLAIEPGHKRPGSYVKGRWCAAQGWPHYATNPADERTLRNWCRAPGAGVGIALGSPVGEHTLVALDYDTADSAELAALMAVVPPSPMRKKGAKGLTAFYRAAPTVVTKAYKIDGRGILDLLAAKRQTVMPPSIHPAGMPYQWCNGSGPVPVVELPVISAEHLIALEDALEGLGWHRGAREGGAEVKPLQGTSQALSSSESDTIWRETNQAALDNLDAWVGGLALPKLARHSGGWEGVPFWRPSSTGQDLAARKPSLKFHHTGIRDMGSGHGLTAVDVVMEALSKDAGASLDWLREKLALPTASVELRFPTSSHVAFDESAPLTQHASAVVWDDRAADDANPHEWLVKHLLSKVGVSMLYGQSGVGKGFIGLELAACIITGETFFGHRVKAPGGVLFALAEGQGAMPPRMAALRKGRFGGVAPTSAATGETLDLDKLPIARLDVEGLCDDTRFRRFAAEVRHTAVEMEARHGCALRLIILDTLNRAFGFPEEPDAPKATAALKKLDDLAKELGFLFLVVHHAGKAREAGETGSHAWRANVEQSVFVDGEKHPTIGSWSKRRINLMKNRHGKEGWNCPFELEPVVLGMDDDGDSFEEAFAVPFDQQSASRVAREASGASGMPSLAVNGGIRRFLDALTPTLEADAAPFNIDGVEVQAVPLCHVKATYVQKQGIDSAAEKRWSRDFEAASRAGLVEVAGAGTGRIVWVPTAGSA